MTRMEKKLLDALCEADCALSMVLSSKPGDDFRKGWPGMAILQCILAYEKIRPLLIEQAEAAGERHAMMSIEECMAHWEADGCLGHLPKRSASPAI